MYSDPSGHTVWDTIKGFFSGFAESISFGASNSFERMDMINDESDYYDGKSIGNLTAGIVSEIGKDGGAFISSSGAGAVVGVPVAAYSVSVQTYSAGAIVKNQVLMATSKDGNIPDYIKNDKVPMDSDTILSNEEYKRIRGKKIKGAQLYKKGNRYYYRDTLHKGKRAHIEVFDKTGKHHLGEMNPITGEIDIHKVDLRKRIDKILK